MTLREYLAREGLTYRTVGERWGIHWTRVGQLCSGRRRPNQATRTWIHVLTQGAVGVSDADWPRQESAWEPTQKSGPGLSAEEARLADAAERDLRKHEGQEP